MTFDQFKLRIQEDKADTDAIIEKIYKKIYERRGNLAQLNIDINHLTELESRSNTLYGVLYLLNSVEIEEED